MLYQGTTLVGPYGPNRDGLYRLRKNSLLCQPRTLVRGSGFSNPRKRFGISIEGFSPGVASSELKPI